ncbi:MAG: RHS repeat-associated core domain-containing protein, partial [Terriglobia bacterium]
MQPRPPPGPFAPWPAIDETTNRIDKNIDPAYDYDDAGNLTSDGLNTYTYDAENRIKTVNGTGATYYYGGAGLRVKKVTGGTTTRYIFSGTKVIAEYVNGAAVGSPTREYIYSGSTLLATLEGGATKYHHSDHLSERLSTDANGNVAHAYGHYPFGETWYETGTADKWKFTRYEREPESTLDYAIFRYHNSRVGRFQTPDPIAGSIVDPQSLNRYAYVRNDPVNLVDPLGLS